MKKRTRSILDELRNIGRIKDTEAFIETTGSNIIESAINLLQTINTNYPPEQAQELEDVFLIQLEIKTQRSLELGSKR